MKKLIKEILPLVLIVLVVVAGRSSLADHYLVPSSSMEYTLLPGDRVVVDKRAFGLRMPFTDWKLTEGSAPKGGDVVVFDSPTDGTRLIKRVVAVGGDRVSVKKGNIIINGKPLVDSSDPPTERFGDKEVLLNLTRGGGPEVMDELIPDDYLLVMGDFRGNSNDGRMFGLIHKDEVYGRALAVYYRRDFGLSWLSL